MKAYAIRFEGTWFYSVVDNQPIFHPNGGHFFDDTKVAEKFLEHIRTRIKAQGGDPERCAIVSFDIKLPDSECN